MIEATWDDDGEAEGFTEDELAEARRYSVVVAWSPEDGVYLADVPEIAGLRTHGATREEAVMMAEEATATALAAKRFFGRPVPAPRFARTDDSLDAVIARVVNDLAASLKADLTAIAAASDPPVPSASIEAHAIEAATLMKLTSAIYKASRTDPRLLAELEPGPIGGLHAMVARAARVHEQVREEEEQTAARSTLARAS